MNLGVTLSQIKMKSEITVIGTIVSANIIKPVLRYGEDQHKFHLAIHPYDCNDFDRLEMMVKDYKEWDEAFKEQDYKANQTELYEPDEPSTYQVRKDRITDKATIVFESLYDPHLYGSLRDVDNDDGFRFKFVKVKGHIQVLKDGNAFLSFHLIDDEQDPIEQMLLEQELTRQCEASNSNNW